MLGKLGKLQGVIVLMWLIAVIAFIVLLAVYPKTVLTSSAGKLGPLKVYSEPNAYAEVDRQKATEFSLEKVASVVNYLLLAAAAVLSFTVKSVIDMRSDFTKAAAGGAGAAVTTVKPPQRALLLLLLHGGIGCFVSLFCGVAAYLYLPLVGTYEAFSINNELGICVLFQILSLLFALVLLLIALGGAVSDLLP